MEFYPPDMSELLPNARVAAIRKRVAVILMLGLGSAAAIYLRAADPVESPFADYENS